MSDWDFTVADFLIGEYGPVMPGERPCHELMKQEAEEEKETVQLQYGLSG
ncbi:hypothetical protein OEJ49_004552 [Vibrio parahaemolyticus]|nr:hypothetical protein [Vibrio parahaemolyticus]EJX7662166.1 hypothetical protein [Vibrio parahaemolyticus]